MFKNYAFTLAEVLITLGIIGIVATVTFPTLINNIQNKQNIAKWKKEYSIISNAIIELKNENYFELLNNESYGRANFTQELLDAVETKISVVDKCHTTSCDNYAWKKGQNVQYKWSALNNTSALYKPLNGEAPIPSYSFNQMAYLFKDGTAAYFGGDNAGAWIVVDVNNFNKGPNEFGRDVFAMKVYNSNNNFWIRPMGADGTYNKDVYNGECPCGRETLSNSSIAGGIYNVGGNIRGGCCSAYYLYK